MVAVLHRTRTPSKRIFSKGILLSSLLLLISCQKIQIKETFYATGKIRTTTQYIEGPNSEIILHGAQMNWFPNGQKASMDRFMHGVQNGYAIKWYPNGKLKSAVYFVDGHLANQSKYWKASGELIADPAGELALLKSN